MNTSKIVKSILIGIVVVSVVSFFVWNFWITLFVSLALGNLACGICGACIMFSRFFKRPMNMETVGIWIAVIFAGIVVFAVSCFYKPRYPHYS